LKMVAALAFERVSHDLLHADEIVAPPHRHAGTVNNHR
jgi:hypothetical protein